MSKQTTNTESTTQTQAAPGAAPGIDPTQTMAFGFEMWSRMTKDGMDRLQSLVDELAEIEGESYQRARATAKQFGAIMDDSMSYFADLSTEWRKLTLAAARKGQELLTRA